MQNVQLNISFYACVIRIKVEWVEIIKQNDFIAHD